MRSSKYLIAQGPTNWYDPLAEAVARRNQQEEKSLAEWEQYRAEKVKVASEESILKVVDQISKFSSSALQLKNAIDAKKAKQKLEETEEFDNKWYTTIRAPGEFDAIDKSMEIRWKMSTDKAYADTKPLQAYLKELRADKNKRFHELADEIEGWSGPELIRARQLMAIREQKTQTKAEFDKWVNSQPYDSEGITQEKYSKYSQEDQEQAYKNWKIRGFAKYQLSEEFLAGVVLKDFKQQTSTHANLAKAAKLTQISDKNDRKHLEYLETFKDNQNLFGQYTVQKLKESAATFEEVDGKTPMQQAVDKLTAELGALAADEYITNENLEDWFEYEFDHAGFSKEQATVLKAFFNQKGDAYRHLVASAQAGKGKTLARNTAAIVLEGDAAMTKALKNDYKSEDEYTAVIDDLENKGAPKELINKMRSIKVSAQSPSSYQLAVAREQEHYDNGYADVTQATIDAEENDVVKRLMQKRFNQLKESRAKYPPQKGNFNSRIHGVASKTIYQEDKGLSGWAESIGNDLDREVAIREAELIWAQYDEQGNLIQRNNNIATELLTLKEGLWTSRGGGQIGKDKDGLYAVTEVGGKFKNYIEAQNIKIAAEDAASINYTQTNGERWESELKEDLKEAGSIQEYINSGKGLTQQDVAGLLTNGIPSDRSEWVSQYLGTNVGTMLKPAIKRIIKEDPDFARTWGLQDIEERDLPDKVIQDGLTRAFEPFEGERNATGELTVTAYQVKDLQRLLKLGWTRMSQNQRQRVILTINNLYRKNPTAVKARLDARSERLADIFVPIGETFTEPGIP